MAEVLKSYHHKVVRAEMDFYTWWKEAFKRRKGHKSEQQSRDEIKDLLRKSKVKNLPVMIETYNGEHFAGYIGKVPEQDDDYLSFHFDSRGACQGTLYLSRIKTAKIVT